MKKFLTMLTLTISMGCSSMNFKATNKKLDLEKFMGTWYVQSGRVTMLENGAHNPIEKYTYNDQKERIDIDFHYNKNSLTGPIKEIGQKGWVVNQPINTHWKISPLWPLKFDYLVLDFDPNYEWTAIGVPSGRYLWLMTRQKEYNKDQIELIKKNLEKIGYPLNDIEIFPHSED